MTNHHPEDLIQPGSKRRKIDPSEPQEAINLLSDDEGIPDEIHYPRVPVAGPAEWEKPRDENSRILSKPSFAPTRRPHTDENEVIWVTPRSNQENSPYEAPLAQTPTTQTTQMTPNSHSESTRQTVPDPRMILGAQAVAGMAAEQCDRTQTVTALPEGSVSRSSGVPGQPCGQPGSNLNTATGVQQVPRIPGAGPGASDSTLPPPSSSPLQNAAIAAGPPPIINEDPPLCPEQAELVDLIVSGRNVFYTGSAGCGKSTVLKVFTKRLREMGKNVRILAPTGRAALNVGGATTWTYAGWTPDAHKRPLEKLKEEAHGKYVWKRFTGTDVLVIDEISSKPLSKPQSRPGPFARLDHTKEIGSGHLGLRLRSEPPRSITYTQRIFTNLLMQWLKTITLNDSMRL
ncbi:uncharacterized protein BCR38DRAFT_65415 [Pseudomassariella vexata]|uniref:DNA helicase n=1 Tax=Pseudomassariella vexata TaxID=1141098 RepID=A0A1Y2DIW0_9PEZI|nr:uncharacterized protein BCR38DRAFT_65415 [Pseudomassariella vexata]ORY59152.1 hypothetical protein BCR38DRAFT_65415 [Pseudomassariella vexata]